MIHVSVKEETELETLPYDTTALTNMEGLNSEVTQKGTFSTFEENQPRTSVMAEYSKEQPGTCFDASSKFEEFQSMISRHGQICCTFVPTTFTEQATTTTSMKLPEQKTTTTTTTTTIKTTTTTTTSSFISVVTKAIVMVRKSY